MEKRHRDPERTRAHIIEIAFEEVYQSGFQGVSIDQIVKKTKVTKGAFFHHFKNKSEMGYAIVDEYLRELILDRWIKPLTAYKNPVQGILKRYKILFDEWSDEYLLLGCPLNNLTQEMSAVDPVFHEKLQSVMEMWISETEKHLKRGVQDGYLKKDTNTRHLAEFVVTMQEGTYAMGKALGSRKIVESLYSTLKEHLVSKSEAKP